MSAGLKPCPTNPRAQVTEALSINIQMIVTGAVTTLFSA